MNIIHINDIFTYENPTPYASFFINIIFLIIIFFSTPFYSVKELKIKFYDLQV